MVNPETQEIVEMNEYHAPWFMGNNVGLGYMCAISSGTVIGNPKNIEYSIFPGSVIDGLVLPDENGKAQYWSKSPVEPLRIMNKK